MRIALVVERFEPAGGGVEAVVWNVARGLRDAGDEVHVIARRATDERGVRVHRIEVPSFWQPLRVAAFSRRVPPLVRRGDFDVVHSFSRTREQDVFSANGGSHADYMRNVYSPLGARLRLASPRHALALRIEGQVFGDPTQTIQCVSRMVQEEIAQRFGVPASRSVVIYNGVDTERFGPERNATARRELRAKLAAGDATVWLFAGSGWRRKGLDTALRSLAAARDHNARLWVAGRDPVRPWQRLAARLGVAERVEFLGARPDLERFYAAADGLLLPTRYDAFALVCLEAAAAGLPVVTSANAGAAELLADAGAIVADPTDVSGFASSLDRLSDARLRERLGEAGRLLASAHTWSAHVEQLRDLYTKLAAGRSDSVTTAAGPDRDHPTRLTTSFAGAKYRGLRLQRFPDAAVTAALAGHQAALARGGPAVLKRDHRARVTAVEAQGHRIVVKQVMKGGLRKRVADLFRGSPGRRAWVAGHGLLARGIPAATPLAFVERRRFGSVIESAVMLEDLRPAKAASQLDDLHEGDATALLCRLAIDLHSRAVRHGDLQASHIFVSGGQDGPRAALIDLEGVRFRRHLSQRSRIQALAELNASLADAALPPAERMRAFARYARALPFRMGNERALARIVELSLERKHRWRGTDCHLA